MPDTEGAEPKTMSIGSNNVFEVGCGILDQLTHLQLEVVQSVSVQQVVLAGLLSCRPPPGQLTATS